MLTYKGGHRVGKGTYWELRNGRRVDVADEVVLPGDEASTYLRMPSGVMLLSGPIIGLLYVIALPFIGIGVVAAFAGRKLVEGMVNLIGKSFSFGWTPKNAYLSGKKKEKTREKEDKK